MDNKEIIYKLEKLFSELFKIIEKYGMGEMQDIIKPISPYSIMQVDRNDIWLNMQSIFNACACVEFLKMSSGTYKSLPNLFKSDEDEGNEQRNERKIEQAWEFV